VISSVSRQPSLHTRYKKEESNLSTGDIDDNCSITATIGSPRNSPSQTRTEIPQETARTAGETEVLQRLAVETEYIVPREDLELDGKRDERPSRLLHRMGPGDAGQGGTRRSASQPQGHPNPPGHIFSSSPSRSLEGENLASAQVSMTSASPASQRSRPQSPLGPRAPKVAPQR
jgi:hypothetical protein